MDAATTTASAADAAAGPELFPITQADPHALLTLAEAAEALRVHRCTLRKWIARGLFPRPRQVRVEESYTATRRVPRPRVLAADVQQYLSQRDGQRRAA